MFKKIKSVILAASTLMVGTTSLLGVATMVAVPAMAQAPAGANNITSNLCTGAGTAANGPNDGGCSNNTTFSLSSIASSAVNILSWVVGVVAVIMIVVGGFRYITSGGSSDKIGSAKNTLIYAIIGLVIVVLAQFIVHYVVTSTSSGTLSPTNQ
ncbi:MAG TPA: pilin [Candidatus Saccharimonadales bacterium]|nr:pilin [Candidatus Saccharimonadales bacterium]